MAGDTRELTRARAVRDRAAARAAVPAVQQRSSTAATTSRSGSTGASPSAGAPRRSPRDGERRAGDRRRRAPGVDRPSARGHLSPGARAPAGPSAPPATRRFLGAQASRADRRSPGRPAVRRRYAAYILYRRPSRVIVVEVVEMLLMGESINGTRKQVAEAIQARDAEFIKTLAQDQIDAGAGLLDVNGGVAGGDEVAGPSLAHRDRHGRHRHAAHGRLGQPQGARRRRAGDHRQGRQGAVHQLDLAASSRASTPCCRWSRSTSARSSASA